MIENEDLTERTEIQERYRALCKAFVVLEGIQRAWSRNEARLVPEEGREDDYAEMDRTLRTLRQMMQELRDRESVIVMKMYGLSKGNAVSAP